MHLEDNKLMYCIQGYFVQERTRTIVDTIQEGKQEVWLGVLDQETVNIHCSI